MRVRVRVRVKVRVRVRVLRVRVRGSSEGGRPAQMIIITRRGRPKVANMRPITK